MPEFKLHAPYAPIGDQPQATEQLVKGFQESNQFQTLADWVKTHFVSACAQFDYQS